MKLNEYKKGMWKRTLKIFTKIKVPWHLYILEIVLGIVSTKAALLLVPYNAAIQLGNIQKPGALTGYIIFSVLNLIVVVIAAVPSIYSQEIVSRNLKNKLISKIVHIPMKTFEKEQASILVSRVTNDSDTANGMIEAIVSFLIGMTSAAMTYQAMTGYQSNMALIMILIFIYVLFCYWIQGKIAFLGDRRRRKSFGIMTAFFAEHTSFFIHIKNLNAGKDAKEKGRDAINEMYRADLYQTALLAVNQLFSGSLGSVITLVIFIFGASYVRSGVMTTEDLAAFQNLTLMELTFVSSFPDLYISLMSSNGSLFYVGKVLEAEEEQDQRKIGMDREDEDIVFENVTFSYDKDPILKNVSFTIPKGKVTALVGTNGSGKSTVFKLIERFYQPDHGTIRFGNDTVEDIHLGEWRQSFGYVLQNTMLFSSSIRENILYGIDREVSEEELIEVAKFANAYEFIQELPGGFDYQVGENGCQLSGGQRQRIAIARAVILDPSYLLLDEATSNMDVYAEKSVMEAIEKLIKGRTTVIVTHRISSIQNADQIIVMKNGIVDGVGSHDHLLSTNATYQELLECE